jgi:hypothetical protein
MRRLLIVAFAFAAFAFPRPAAAADHELDLWLNPSVSTRIDDRTALEFETAQRFRQEPADDTYFFRLWVNRDLSDDVTLGLGAERRFEGAREETRMLQQLSYPVGPIEMRTRLEQRFLSDDPRTAWRLRHRVGSGVPLSGEEDGWSLVGDIEGFFTLRAASPGGATGLTGVRSFLGFERAFGRVELSVGYLRQQDIRRNAEDRVGHAPFIGLAVEL